MEFLRGLRQSRAVAWIAPALIALVPVVIGTIYPKAIFDQIGSVDSYEFVGLGLNYDGPGYTGGGYKVSRVPWILTEYLFRHVLPPLTAQYALQFFTHILLGLCIYFALRRLLGLAPAFLGALFLLTFTELYAGSPPDYMNAFAGAMLAVTFLLTTISARKPPSYRLFAACGAAFALAVHTDPYFLIFAPSLLAHVIVLRRQSGLPKDLGHILLGSVAGAAAASVALGLIAVAFGQSFNYVWPSLRWILEGYGAAKLTWYQPWSSGWWHDAGYFGCYSVIAVFSLLLGLYLLWMRPGENRVTTEISLLFQFVYVFCVLALAQTAGHATLTPNHAAFPLLVPCAIAIAALSSWVWSSDDYHPSAAVAVAMWMLIVAPLVLHPVLTALRAPLSTHSPFAVSVWTTALIVVVVLASRLIKVRQIVSFLALALTLGLANIESASSFSAGLIFQPTSCAYDRDGYLALVDLNHVLRSVRPMPSDFFILENDQEATPFEGCGRVNLGDLGWSLRSMGNYPLLTPERQNRNVILSLGAYVKDPYILVASLEPDSTTKLLRKFAAYGFTMVTEPVHVQEGKLMLDFVAVRRPLHPAK